MQLRGIKVTAAVKEIVTRQAHQGLFTLKAKKKRGKNPKQCVVDYNPVEHAYILDEARERACLWYGKIWKSGCSNVS